MAKMERYNEQTPSGAASWDIIFLDNTNNPVDESEATWYRIHEFDKNGIMLREHEGIFL